jgi:hypothetical protein
LRSLPGEAFHPEPGVQIEHYARINWMGNWAFAIPPGGASDSSSCTATYDMKVFGLSSHAHKWLTRFNITVAGQRVYESTDWEHPKYESLDPPIDLSAGESIGWTCTWQNSGFETIYPGAEAQTSEMCIAFSRTYPTNMKEGPQWMCNNFF